jgi:hypothetical protein
MFHCFVHGTDFHPITGDLEDELCWGCHDMCEIKL